MRKESGMARPVAGELFGDLLTRGIKVRVRVTGGSMFPAVRSGDVVTLAPMGPGAAGPGDVVLLRDASDRLVLHRVVSTGTGADGHPFVLTRGDSAVGEDLPVSGDRILGRVEAVTRRPLWMEALSRARMAARRVIPFLIQKRLNQPWRSNGRVGLVGFFEAIHFQDQRTQPTDNVSFFWKGGGGKPFFFQKKKVSPHNAFLKALLK